jgi:HJR/Mrr/RecB family endonuclease
MMTVRILAGGRRIQGQLSDDTGVARRLSRLTFVLVMSSIITLMWATWLFGVADLTLNRWPDWLEDVVKLGTAAVILTLLALWGLVVWQRQKNLRRRMSAMTREALYTLNPREFEHFVAELFEQRGYMVGVRGRSGDLGVDLEIIDSNGRRAIVQCKRYRHPIGPDVVRELFGTMVHEMAFHGFLVTTAEISGAAREWARGKPITLIDGSALVNLTSR